METATMLVKVMHLFGTQTRFAETEGIVGIVDEKGEQIAALCRKYAVLELYLFGSASREDFGPHSDIDLAVVFSRTGFAGRFDQYFDFKTELEHLLQRPVDLVCAASIRNSVFRRELEETKRLIYAACTTDRRLR